MIPSEKANPGIKQFFMPTRVLQDLPADRSYKLLDIGAAKERYLAGFLPKNIKYHGQDIAGNQEHNFDLNKFPYPLKDGQFDIIVCLETLEHTVYPHKVMQELKRIAKPDALFFLSMPNEYNFYCRLNFLFGKKTSMQLPPFG